MKIYDISRELFQTPVYPGDPAPTREAHCSIEAGAPCNVSVIRMGSHNSTHIDAPYHFITDGKKIDEIPLDKCVGDCYVIHMEGTVTKQDLADKIPDNCKRFLIKGDILLTPEAAEYIAKRELYLLGVESWTVGNEQTGYEIHNILLEAEVVIIEYLNLKEVEAGTYFLSAVPLNGAGLDGAPCRPVLIEHIDER